MRPVIPQRSTEAVLDALVERAVLTWGVPRQLALRARSATVRNLGRLDDSPSEGAAQHRVSCYFTACLRKMSALSVVPEAREYRRRAIAASLAADLRQAGADEMRVMDEVSACMGARVEELLRAG